MPRKMTLPEIGRDDLHWLAGLLEGEGSFLKPPPSKPATPIVVVAMTDRDVVERIAGLLGAAAYLVNERRNPRWKPYYRVTITGGRAAHLMKLIYPLMGMRRQQQITEALTARDASMNRSRLARVPDDRRTRNLEIARRLSGGESGVALAQEFGVTHQNIYYIGNRYKNVAACPRG